MKAGCPPAFFHPPVTRLLVFFKARSPGGSFATRPVAAPEGPLPRSPKARGSARVPGLPSRAWTPAPGASARGSDGRSPGLRGRSGPKGALRSRARSLRARKGAHGIAHKPSGRSRSLPVGGDSAPRRPCPRSRSGPRGPSLWGGEAARHKGSARGIGAGNDECNACRHGAKDLARAHGGRVGRGGVGNGLLARRCLSTLPSPGDLGRARPNASSTAS